MLIRKAIVWALERGAELFTGAVLAFIIYGPSNFPAHSTWIEEIRLNLFGVGFFYVASGFVVSCVAFGLLLPRRKPLSHGALIGTLFVAHALLFFAFIARGSELPLAPIASGAVAVFLINVAGTSVLKVERASPRV